MRKQLKTLTMAMVCIAMTVCVSCKKNNENPGGGGTGGGTGGTTHEYVDLGLPSGLLWATCNVGATNAEDCGDYFAWGETSQKSSYDLSNYKWCKGSDTTMTKYCTQSDFGYNGFVDNKTVLELEDDAARVNWGDNWRMPTETEMDELSKNCTWTWMTLNGKYGYLVTGKNGNSIFLPAAGYREGTSLEHADSRGYYWTSSLTSRSDGAFYLFIDSANVDPDSESMRNKGFSVRPVR